MYVICTFLAQKEQAIKSHRNIRSKQEHFESIRILYDYFMAPWRKVPVVPVHVTDTVDFPFVTNPLLKTAEQFDSKFQLICT